MQALWLLIPEEAMVLVFVAIGFCIMFGVFSIKKGFSLIGMLCLLLLLTPFIGSLIEQLPDWAFIILCGWLMFTLAAAILGRKIIDGVMTLIIFNIIAFPFKLLWRIITPGRRTR